MKSVCVYTTVEKVKSNRISSISSKNFHFYQNYVRSGNRNVLTLQKFQIFYNKLSPNAYFYYFLCIKFL